MYRYSLILLIVLFCLTSVLLSNPLPLLVHQGRVLFRYDAADANQVFLAGSFNDWNPTATALRKMNDGTWMTRLFLEPGSYEYKYVINGEWMEGDNIKFTLSRDSSGNLIISEPALHRPSAPTVQIAPLKKLQPINATTHGPQSLRIFNNKIAFYYNDRNANKVNIAGNFNDWNPTATSLEKISSNEWAIAKALNPGKYEYKYIINGEWMEGDNLTFEVKRDSSGNLIVEDDLAPIKKERLISAPVSPVKFAAEPFNLKDIDIEQTFPILHKGWIVFRYDDSRARKITIAGVFNDWDAEKTPLTEIQNGIWLGKLRLDAGNYEYKYVIDGNWMDGANLILKVEKDKSGELYLPEAKPLSNIPYSDKIYIEGNYYTDMRYMKSEEGAYRWQKPLQDIDINFSISVIPEIEALAQIKIKSEHGDYYTSLDKANLIYNSQYFRAGFYQNLRKIFYNDPVRLLEQYSINFDNNIYLFNDVRSEYKNFGRERSVVFIDVPELTNNFNLFFFASNNREGSDDINSLKFNYTAPNINIGATYLNNVFEDGLWGSPGGNDGFITGSEQDLWINFPRGQGGWQHFDAAIGLDDDKNYLRQVSFDVAYNLLSKSNLFFQYINNEKKSAGVAYADGIDDETNDDIRTKYVLAGEEYTADKFIIGFQSDFIKNKLSAQLSYSFEDISLTTIHSDTLSILAEVNPQKTNINFITKFNHNNIYANFMIGLQDIKDVNEGIYYENFDEYEFKNFQLEGVDKTTSIMLQTGIAERIRRKDFKADFKIFYNDYSIERNPMIDDMTTMSIYSHLSYNFYDKFTANLMYRFKQYDIKNVTNSLNTGDLKESFGNLHFDVTYDITKDVYVQLGYGYSLIPDEERYLNLPYALNNQFLYAADVLGGSTIDQLLASEKALEDANFFFIKGNMRF